MIVLNKVLDSDVLSRLQKINVVDHAAVFDRYDNPFERKWVLHKSGTTFSIESLIYEVAFQAMMHPKCLWWISRLLDVPISHADWTHYGGMFIYEPGDFLAPHVDAGIHPTKNLRKVATAILYLTPATVEFWHGEPARYSQPQVTHVENTVELEANSLLLFTNNDYAWHGVPPVKGEPRVCITCSYLAPQEFEHKDFENYRTRAYFARIEDTVLDKGLEALRELRASEQHYMEVYRT